MMMVVVMMVMPMPPDHNHRSPRMGVVMMVVMMSLGKLHRALGARSRRLIHRAQRRRSVADRLKQVGVGIGLQHVGRRRRGNRGSLSCGERAERGHCAEQTSNFLIHGGFLRGHDRPEPQTGRRPGSSVVPLQTWYLLLCGHFCRFAPGRSSLPAAYRSSCRSSRRAALNSSR